MHQPGDWARSLEHREPCRVVEAQDLWGDAFYRVWVPSQDAVVCVRGDHLGSTRDGSLCTTARVDYVAEAWRPELDRRSSVSPELVPLVLLRVEGRGGEG